MKFSTPERLEPGDPDLCKRSGPAGQCHFRRLEGSDYCAHHGGNTGYAAKQQKMLQNYKLASFYASARANELSGTATIKSLQDEVALSRLMLEELMNQITGPTDILLHAPRVSQMIESVRKTVESCVLIDTKLGKTVTRDELIDLFGKILEIIIELVPDEEVRGAIGSRIEGLLESSANNAQSPQ